VPRGAAAKGLFDTVQILSGAAVTLHIGISTDARCVVRLSTPAGAHHLSSEVFDAFEVHTAAFRPTTTSHAGAI
jgi:hypothetical protein